MGATCYNSTLIYMVVVLLTYTLLREKISADRRVVGTHLK